MKRILGIVILVLIAAACSAWLYHRDKLAENKAIYYQNSKLGFSINLPAEWSNYTITQDDNLVMTDDKNMPVAEGMSAVTFELPTTDANWLKGGVTKGDVFIISAFPLSQMDKLKEFCSGPNPGIWTNCLAITSPVAKNNKYIFSYLRADKITDYPSDFTSEFFSRVDSVMRTFKVSDINQN